MPDFLDPVALLDDAAERLEQARKLEDVEAVVRTTARRLVQADGATFVLLEGDQCYYADEDSMSPLWKGQRFRATECISGWSMFHHQTAVIPDIRYDERIPQAAYQPTFVRSLIMAPMLAPKAVGAIGVYWARWHSGTDDEVSVLEKLAELAGQAVERFPHGLPDPGFQI